MFLEVYIYLFNIFCIMVIFMYLKEISVNKEKVDELKEKLKEENKHSRNDLKSQLNYISIKEEKYQEEGNFKYIRLLVLLVIIPLTYYLKEDKTYYLFSFKVGFIFIICYVIILSYLIKWSLNLQ